MDVSRPWIRLAPRLLAFAVLALAVAAVSLRAPVFLSGPNLTEILLSASTSFIVACPLALLMIGGGLDFSVGATFTVGAIAACSLMTHGVPWPLAVIAGVAAGGVAGLVSGLLVTRWDVPPIIATLAVFFVCTGLVNASAKGLIVGLPQRFLWLAQSSFLGLPGLVLWAAVIGVAAWAVLHKTPVGYSIRAIGGSSDAAVGAGVPYVRIKLSLYVLCGAVAAFAGILYAARTSTGQPGAGGLSVTLEALTAVLVGGVSLTGARGSIAGVAGASVLFAGLRNALGVIRLDPVWSDVAIGVVLILAVVLDQWRRRTQFAAATATSGPMASVSRAELARLVKLGARIEASRISAAVNRERKRIERDLHDGAQQSIVLALLMLGQAADAAQGNAKASELVGRSTETLRGALRELRNLSRGIYPTTLGDHGLVPAIESMVRGSVLSVDLDMADVGRFDEQIETAAYFVVAEGMTNALKHAPMARVTISVDRADGQVHVAVSDDGHGGADCTKGSGLRGLFERVAAMGGEFTVDSPAGGGTRIAARMPAIALADERY